MQSFRFVLTEKGPTLHSPRHDYSDVNQWSLSNRSTDENEREKNGKILIDIWRCANKAPTTGTGAKEFNGDATQNLSSWRTRITVDGCRSAYVNGGGGGIVRVE